MSTYWNNKTFSYRKGPINDIAQVMENLEIHMTIVLFSMCCERTKAVLLVTAQ